MTHSPTCPVCEDVNWAEIRRYSYSKESAQHDPYTAECYRVLFEVWCPDRNSLDIWLVVCQSCGFVTYLPRPSAEDVANKYRLLVSIGRPGYSPGLTDPHEAHRSKQLVRLLANTLPASTLKILDFGGGNGRLVFPFSKLGHACYTMDYCEVALPGINLLKPDADLIPQDLTFDVLICTHVLEHVADPLSILISLRRHLSDKVVIYAEVPLEIWDNAPHLLEPVTHINFFTPESFTALFRRAGFAPVRSRTTGYSDAKRRTVVIQLWAKPGPMASAKDVRRGSAATQRLLNPTLAIRLQRLLMHPEQLPRVVSSKLRLLARPCGSQD